MDELDTDSTEETNIYKGKEIEDLMIQVKKAAGQKCERCWRYDVSVGDSSEHPAICGRCVEAL